MYYSVFQSSEYNSDEIDHKLKEEEDINKPEDINNPEDIDNCIICWQPGCETNKLYLLPEIPNIQLYCDCQPKIHQQCLNVWIIKTRSCPICRKLITIKVHLNRNSIFLNMRLFAGQYIKCLFKIYFGILCVNLIIILVDHIAKENPDRI